MSGTPIMMFREGPLDGQQLHLPPGTTVDAIEIRTADLRVHRYSCLGRANALDVLSWIDPKGLRDG